MCRIDYEDCNSVTLASGRRKARKPHICDECRRQIAVGEKYHFSDFVVEGSHGCHKLCDRCEVPASWLMANCGGYIQGEVLEEIREHAEEYPALSDPLLRLVRGMRLKWRDGDGMMLPIPDQAPPIKVSELPIGNVA